MSLTNQPAHTSEGRWIHPLPSHYYKQRAESIRLVHAVVKLNPHLQVLCPTLAEGSRCRRSGINHRKELWYRPELLVKNHADPSLQLWSCPGCTDFLLRVKLP